MLTHLPTIYLDSDRPVCYFITPDNERHWRTLYNFREIEFTYPNKAECYKDVKVFHAFKDTNTDLKLLGKVLPKDLVVFSINEPDVYSYDIRCRLLIDLAFKSIITEGNDQFSFELKDGLGYLRLV